MRPTSKRDPWPRYRPTGKCPLYRYEATGQLLHSDIGSNQVGCRCPWQRSLSCETNIRATEEIPAPNQTWRGCNHPTRLRIGHRKATKSHILPWGPVTVCHHCSQTLTIDHIYMLLECAVLQECCEYYTVGSLNTLFETIPETCIVEFLRKAGFFYLTWCNLLTSTSPQIWTIWSDLSNLFRKWQQLWGTFTWVGRLICPEGRVSSLNKSNPANIYLCRTANMSWRTRVIVKQIQSISIFEKIPETCILELLQEAGFFYLVWCNLLTSTGHQTWTI